MLNKIWVEMKIGFALLFWLLAISCFAQDASTLPVWNTQLESLSKGDWLVQPTSVKASVYKSPDGKDIILFNGLVKRVFRITPNVVCTDYKNLSNGQQLLRAVKPEAKIILDDKEYNIGGLYGQTENAYLLPSWVDELKAGETDFKFTKLSVSPITPFLNWKSKTWTGNKTQATGKLLSFTFESPLKELEWFYRNSKL